MCQTVSTVGYPRGSLASCSSFGQYKFDSAVQHAEVENQLQSLRYVHVQVVLLCNIY